MGIKVIPLAPFCYGTLKKPTISNYKTISIPHTNVLQDLTAERTLCSDECNTARVGRLFTNIYKQYRVPQCVGRSSSCVCDTWCWTVIISSDSSVYEWTASFLHGYNVKSYNFEAFLSIFIEMEWNLEFFFKFVRYLYCSDYIYVIPKVEYLDGRKISFILRSVILFSEFSILW